MVAMIPEWLTTFLNLLVPLTSTAFGLQCLSWLHERWKNKKESQDKAATTQQQSIREFYLTAMEEVRDLKNRLRQSEVDFYTARQENLQIKSENIELRQKLQLLQFQMDATTNPRLPQGWKKEQETEQVETKKETG